MGAPMTDERIAYIRRSTEDGAISIGMQRDLLAEVDYLRAALANVNEVHVCIAPGARPMCDYDGETWPCTTVAAMGDDARFSWDEQ